MERSCEPPTGAPPGRYSPAARPIISTASSSPIPTTEPRWEVPAQSCGPRTEAPLGPVSPVARPIISPASSSPTPKPDGWSAPTERSCTPRPAANRREHRASSCERRDLRSSNQRILDDRQPGLGPACPYATLLNNGQV